MTRTHKIVYSWLTIEFLDNIACSGHSKDKFWRADIIAFGQLNNRNELELPSDIERSYQRESKILNENSDDARAEESQWEA